MEINGEGSGLKAVTTRMEPKRKETVVIKWEDDNVELKQSGFDLCLAEKLWTTDKCHICMGYFSI